MNIFFTVRNVIFFPSEVKKRGDEEPDVFGFVFSFSPTIYFW